ncbi:MAG: acyl-CoA carboxylase subunit beta [Stackebrandtia sp.]
MTSLFDAGTMTTIVADDGSGVMTARGDISGTPALAYCSDARLKGGAMGVDGCRHIVDTIDTALRERVPVVGIWHCGGARIPEGVVALNAVGEVFAAMIRASGRIPQISVVLGPAAGGAAYGPALTDIVIMSENGRIFVTGPEVVKSVTGEQADMENLGGPDVHARKSGVAHVTTKDDSTAIETARDLACLLGHQGHLQPADAVDAEDLAQLLPEQANRAYNVKPLVKHLLDSGDGVELPVELHGKWAPNVVTVLGRFAGRTVGVIANNPMRLGGCLNAESAEKAARFVRMCDALGVPMIVLVDVPGYLPGLGQEWEGVVRRGAKLLHAFAESVVPRVTLVTRKAYGGAYIAMNSRALGATAVFAWPDFQVAVMGAPAAVNVLHRKELAAASPEERETLREKLIAEHEAGGTDKALEIGVIDEVINPAQTRHRLASALAEAPSARGSHGNIPL